jgi:hypothetical protein
MSRVIVVNQVGLWLGFDLVLNLRADFFQEFYKVLFVSWSADLEHWLTQTPTNRTIQCALANSFRIERNLHYFVRELPNFCWPEPSVECSFIDIYNRQFVFHNASKCSCIAASLQSKLVLLNNRTSVHFVRFAKFYMVLQVKIPQRSRWEWEVELLLEHFTAYF